MSKGNIAIFAIHDSAGRSLYSNFAMSGEDKWPGASIASEAGPLQPIEARDEFGMVYNRCADAEFKLLADFCNIACNAQNVKVQVMTAVLWSKKPLCLSCACAVKQLQQHLPCLQVEVVIYASIEDRKLTKMQSSWDAKETMTLNEKKEK